MAGDYRPGERGPGTGLRAREPRAGARGASARGKPHGATRPVTSDLRYLARMLITIFSCISTALVVYCILKRVHQRALELAVRLAVREVEKEFEVERAKLLAQVEAKIGAKEGELKKARQIAQLHEAVPSTASAAKAKAPAGAPPAKPVKRPREDALHVFEMSRPFTDTSYDALLAASNVVKIEPAGM
jgi:hypothetical protein